MLLLALVIKLFAMHIEKLYNNALKNSECQLAILVKKENWTIQAQALHQGLVVELDCLGIFRSFKSYFKKPLAYNSDLFVSDKVSKFLC